MEVKEGGITLTVEFDDPGAFLEQIWRAQTARDDPYQQAIFRGHCDATWPLMPAAYRPRGEERLRKLFRAAGNRKQSSDMNKSGDHIFAEMAALSLFYKSANEQALPLPQMPDFWHQALLTPLFSLTTGSQLSMLSGKPFSWPPVELLPIIGLAQHYGVPTRLLDWSTDCYVAAYFAAVSSLRSKEKPERLAVVSTFRGPIGNTSPALDLQGLVPSYQIRLIEVPYAGNPNLAAQRGLFSAVIPSQPRQDGQFDRTTIDQAYSAIRREFKGHQLEQLLFDKSDGRPIFFKATFPTAKARELLALLHKRGYDGAKLFPGYQGGEIAMQELELLEPALEAV